MRLAVVLLGAAALVHATPAPPSTLLCTDTALDASAVASLRLCRKLGYAFCIDTQLVRSLGVHVDAAAANARATALHVDAALADVYETVAERAGTDTNCAYHWRNHVCSQAFLVRHGDADALPACAALCRRAEQACGGELQCAVGSAQNCTDYVRDTGIGVACSGGESGGGGGGPVDMTRASAAGATKITFSVATLILLTLFQ